MLTNTEHQLSCGSSHLGVGVLDEASADIFVKSLWVDLNTSDEEGLKLSRASMITSGASTKSVPNDGRFDCTSGDNVAKPRPADWSSDEEGFDRSHTTRVSSDRSILTGISSEDDGITHDVTSHSNLDAIQTQFNETHMVLKNTFLHVSDELDEEMAKDIRRVQSCPDRFDCSQISLQHASSHWLALKSSWQYLRVRCEKTENSFRTRLTSASLKDPRRLPKGTQDTRKAEEVCGIENDRSWPTLLDRQRRVRSVHGIGSSGLAENSKDNLVVDIEKIENDIEMDLVKNQDPIVEVQSLAAESKNEIASNPDNHISLSGLDTENDFLYLEDKFVQNNQDCHMPFPEDAKLSGCIQVLEEMSHNTSQADEPQSGYALSATVAELCGGQGFANEEPSDKVTFHDSKSDLLIVNNDVPPFTDLEYMCDEDDGKYEHSRTTYVSSRLNRDANSKLSQTTRKHRQPKMKQQQRHQLRSGTCASCKPVQFSLRKALELITENTGSFTITCVLIVVVIILGKIGVENSPPEQPEGCFRSKMPSFLTVTSEPRMPRVTDEIPTITLYAPCLLDSFARVSAHYTVSASAWNFVESQGSPKIEVRNYREEPSVMWENLDKVWAIEEFLLGATLPLVGRLTEFTSQFYGSLGERDEGLIIGLFEPDMEEETVNDKYRPMLTDVAKAMRGTYHVTYMNTKQDHVWAESQFGAVYFPAIAIIRKYPGKTFLYTGDMSAPAVLQFLKSFGGDCLRRSARDEMRALMGYAESRDEVCDAFPVLRA